MPDISLPEIRLKARLPEGLRDMTVDDIQSAMPDVRAPRVDLAKIELPKLELPRIDLGREAGRAAKRADKAARSARKSAGREAAKAAKAVENVLPRRKGPNPVPIAILAMLGGVVVGWLLAVNPVTGPKVSAMMDSARRTWEGWRSGSTHDDDEWDTTDAQAYPASLRAPVEPEPFSGTLDESATGMSSDAGQLPAGMGTTDPDRVGAGNGTSSVPH
jgi:hypothetical protein